ncbi:MAG: hypothetical protein DBY13_09770 [Lachnospiraceae bacterium]|nr:MAG: hypothetical protein DBY13_09770 [Lachnospiraceae bacterium]
MYCITPNQKSKSSTTRKALKILGFAQLWIVWIMWIRNRDNVRNALNNKTCGMWMKYVLKCGWNIKISTSSNLLLEAQKCG